MNPVIFLRTRHQIAPILPIIAAAMFTAALGCKQRLEGNLSQPKLIGGTEADHGQFPSTIALPGCTGVKIGPYQFLTAAHCVVDSDTGTLAPPYRRDATLSVRHGARPAQVRPMKLTVAETRIHHSYRSAFDKELPNFIPQELREKVVDVAVVIVKDLSAGIPAAVIDTEAPPNGSAIIVSGYGCESEFSPLDGTIVARAENEIVENEEEPSPRTRLKWMATTVQGREGTLLNFRNRYQPEPELKLCSGDSGGPVYRDDRVDGTQSKNHSFRRVVGINSHSQLLHSSFTRVDQGGLHPLFTCLKDLVESLPKASGTDDLPVFCRTFR